ncbi:MAG: hypothetical protein ACP5G1_04495, partial [Nanopusillaceae archaeon]
LLLMEDNNKLDQILNITATFASRFEGRDPQLLKEKMYEYLKEHEDLRNKLIGSIEALSKENIPDGVKRYKHIKKYLDSFIHSLSPLIYHSSVFIKVRESLYEKNKQTLDIPDVYYEAIDDELRWGITPIYTLLEASKNGLLGITKEDIINQLESDRNLKEWFKISYIENLDKERKSKIKEEGEIDISYKIISGVPEFLEDLMRMTLKYELEKAIKDDNIEDFVNRIASEYSLLTSKERDLNKEEKLSKEVGMRIYEYLRNASGKFIKMLNKYEFEVSIAYATIANSIEKHSYKYRSDIQELKDAVSKYKQLVEFLGDIVDGLPFRYI